MGALLDIRIMELTHGKKDLHDIILTLRATYGPNKSFNDDAIIKEFVGLVHADLQQFFDDYVTGKEELPVKAYLNKVGIAYDQNYEGAVMMDPLLDLGYKTRGRRSSEFIEIKKIPKVNPYQLQVGDRVLRYSASLDNEYGGLEQGTPLELEVQRGEKVLHVPFEVSYKSGRKKHFIRLQRTPSESQVALQALWFKN